MSPLNRLAVSDVIQWARELAALLRMGYHMPEALARLKSSARSSIRPVLDTLEQRTLAGDVLGDAVARTGAFPPMVVRGLAAARDSQAILQTLDHLANMLERDEDRRLGIVGALAYPRLLLLIVAVLGWLMLGPVLHAFYSSNQTELSYQMSNPDQLQPYTAAAYGLSTWLCSWPGLLGLIVMVGFLEGVMSGWWGTTRWWPRLPLIGSRMRLLDTITWCDWLNHLLAQGAPLPEAVSLAAEGAMSEDFTTRMKRVVKRLEQGGTLSDSLAAERVVPPSAGWLIAHAEAIQFARPALDRAARCMERGLLEKNGRDLAMLEPLAVLGLGLVMGLALSFFFLPLYTLMGHLH
ncbi:MAG TPA: type II secretion system F family protein [Candidatus Xenobia bacterium]|jgi:type II secretory pathway component PulF